MLLFLCPFHQKADLKLQEGRVVRIFFQKLINFPFCWSVFTKFVVAGPTSEDKNIL